MDEEYIKKITEELINKFCIKRDKNESYIAGFDCGYNGATKENCHFALFSSIENTEYWEQGKKDGEEQRKKDMPDIN